jgi:hypothetical protein
MKKMKMVLGVVFLAMVFFCLVANADDRAALRGDFSWVGGTIYELLLYEKKAGSSDFVLIGENPNYNMKSFDEIIESYEYQGYDVDVVITVRKKNPSSIPVPSYTGGCQDEPWNATHEWGELPEGYYAVMIDARNDGTFKWKLVFRRGEYIVPVNCPKEDYYPTAAQLDEKWGNAMGNFYPWMENRFVFE